MAVDNRIEAIGTSQKAGARPGSLDLSSYSSIVRTYQTSQALKKWAESLPVGEEVDVAIYSSAGLPDEAISSATGLPREKILRIREELIRRGVLSPIKDEKEALGTSNDSYTYSRMLESELSSEEVSRLLPVDLNIVEEIPKTPALRREQAVNFPVLLDLLKDREKAISFIRDVAKRAKVAEEKAQSYLTVGSLPKGLEAMIANMVRNLGPVTSLEIYRQLPEVAPAEIGATLRRLTSSGVLERLGSYFYYKLKGVPYVRSRRTRNFTYPSFRRSVP